MKRRGFIALLAGAALCPEGIMASEETERARTSPHAPRPCHRRGFRWGA